MPIYEYNCQRCHTSFEEIVGAGDPPPPCPSCQSSKTEKLMSACRHRSGGSSDGGYDMGGSCDSGACGSASSGCSGCSGGNCASCH